jgi:hypothetical protein
MTHKTCHAQAHAIVRLANCLGAKPRSIFGFSLASSLFCGNIDTFRLGQFLSIAWVCRPGIGSRRDVVPHPSRALKAKWGEWIACSQGVAYGRICFWS